MELTRTQCQRFVIENGEAVSVVDKIKYNTLKKAQNFADEQNLLMKRKDKVVPYHCRICDKYHVGRNGEELTQEDADEIWERTKPDKYRISGLKILGKLDLSKVALSNKDRRRIAKEKRKLENLKNNKHGCT